MVTGLHHNLLIYPRHDPSILDLDINQSLALEHFLRRRLQLYPIH